MHDSGPSLHTMLDSGARMSDCSAARGHVAFQQRTFQSGSPQVSGGSEGVTAVGGRLSVASISL